MGLGNLRLTPFTLWTGLSWQEVISIRHPNRAGLGLLSRSAVFPDLPGCASAGDTEEEAVANAKEALAWWF